MQLHDTPNDGQPQAGALGLAGEERLEDLVAIVLGHSRPAVGDLDDQAAALGAHGDGDRRAGGDRVVEQVDHDLADPPGVE